MESGESRNLGDYVNLDFVSSLFEVIRVVDPEKKRVLYLKNGSLKDLEKVCYGFWARGAVCENCVSMQALTRKEPVVKLEHLEGRVFLILAAPVNRAGGKAVLELLRDVTENMAPSDAGSVNTEVRNMIKYLNDLTVKDDLTGLFNKRFLYERLAAELADPGQWPLSVIVTDIDHFKKVNDTYGHLVGDEILKAFARILDAECRKGRDWVARFGGEEFVICLTNTDGQGAYQAAERIRQKVAETVFLSGGGQEEGRITASFGLCTYHGEVGETPEGLIECGDSKLLEAKNSGRNRVVG